MYRKSRTTDRKADFYILDLVLFAASYIIGYLCRFGFQIVEYLSDVIVRFGVILLIAYIIVAFFTRAYRNILRRNKWIELISVIGQVALTLIVFLLYLYVTKQSEALARMMFAYMAASAVALIWCARCVYKYLLRKHYQGNIKLPHLMLVAEADKVQACVDTISSQHFNEFYLCAVAVINSSAMTGVDFIKDGENIEKNYSDIIGSEFTDNPAPDIADGYNKHQQLKSYVLNHVVDEVMLVVDDEAERLDLAEYFLEAGIVVHISLDDQKVSLPHAMTEYVGGRLVLTAASNTASSVRLAVKRIADICGALAGLLITGILYIIIAPQIKRKDPGPAIFRQERVGKNGRIFRLYKFRSMYMDAEARKAELASDNVMDGMMFKIEDDPRIIPGIGHTIRSWSLDEFPQFLNVLKGDMSLVGTRPPTLDEYGKYEAHHKSRLSFRPGITGLWQTNGRNEITDFEEVVGLDNEYIKNWSLWLDIRLIFKTIGVVFKRKGSM